MFFIIFVELSNFCHFFKRFIVARHKPSLNPILKRNFSKIQRHGKKGIHLEHAVVRRFEVLDAEFTRYYLLIMSIRVEDSCEGKSTYRKINKQMKF